MIEPNNDEVICPACAHQFRAIPVNVQAELRALSAPLAAVPAEPVGGWKLVPEVPTKGMIAASDRTISGYDDQEGDFTRRQWRNMLAAASEPKIAATFPSNLVRLATALWNSREVWTCPADIQRQIEAFAALPASPPVGENK